MKKNIVSIIILLLLVSILTFTFGFDDNKQNVHISLPLNTDATSHVFNNDAVFNHGNQNYFGKGTKELGNSSIQLQFSMTPVEENINLFSISGNGVIKINGETFPIKIKDYVDKYTLTTGQDMLYGPARGSITTNKGDLSMNLDIHYIIGTKNKEIAITISDLGSADGVGAAIFGQSFLTKDIIDILKAGGN